MDTIHAAYFLAPSTPGGMARQYRVQYQPTPGKPWRLSATYRDRKQAEICLRRLSQLGLPTRLIEHAICPAAS